jgi:hypothetical protein
MTERNLFHMGIDELERMFDDCRSSPRDRSAFGG